MTAIEALLGVYAGTGLLVGYVIGYAVRSRKARQEMKSARTTQIRHAR